eukprot:TRINITY_DN2273_c0_g6_i1.p1 TRINITY_DN2273_c0_g6~~TRINITY_DN2273_c0_g6_i1.p1  ORF type:complete len:513 (+),score=106.17 TRINITY_DN2273_c0_g6_i1:83-1621(+)
MHLSSLFCLVATAAAAPFVRLGALRDMEKDCLGVNSSGFESLNSNGDVLDPTEPPKSLYKYIRRLSVPSSKGVLPYYSQGNLSTGGSYKMAVIMFHGATRNGFAYFCTAVNTIRGNQRWRQEDVLVVAPNFAYNHDWLVAVEGRNVSKDLYWVSGLLDYRTGSRSSRHFADNSSNPVPVSSFAVIDQMVALLNNTRLFPNLKMISLVGHSAGAQVVQRYALSTHYLPPMEIKNASEVMPGEITIRPELDIRFVVANPSSWAYLDERRWAYDCKNTTKSCDQGELAVPSQVEARHETDEPDGEFFTVLPNGQGVTGDDGSPMIPYHTVNPKGKFFCYDPDYNKWHYGVGSGFDNDTHAYLAAVNITRQVQLYPFRNVWYLTGSLDKCTPAMPWYNQSGVTNPSNDVGINFTDACDFHHIDTRCPAMLEGPWRSYREVHYLAYLYKFYGFKVHNVIMLTVDQDMNLVPNSGHDGTMIYNSSEGKAAVYTPVYQSEVFSYDDDNDNDDAQPDDAR